MMESLVAEKINSLLGGPPTEAAIEEITSAMLKLPQVDCPVIHRFGPGTYIREASFPADSLVVGFYHNFEHTNVFLKGRLTMLNPDGTTSELKAPMIFVGKPGRKIAYMHEDVVWLNLYATEERDVEKLEAHLLRKSIAWEEDLVIQRNLKLLQAGLSAAIPESTEELELTELPHGGYKIKVSASVIHGQGLFATAEIEPSEVIAPARIAGKQTVAERFVNHSESPNAAMERIGNDFNLIATGRIAGCKGGRNGDEITINYRDFETLKQIRSKS
jgi:hypothetical protein